MSSLTALLFGALFIYVMGWFLDKWGGNFSLLLFILTAVTFLYWLAERLYFKPEREAVAREIGHEAQQRRAELAQRGIDKVDGDVREAQHQVLSQPWWLDWTAGLFPVILIVFLLRSFLFEPFKIPSGSMIPTLHIGDLILVNKYHYGVRLPVIHKKIVPLNDPQRGDVMVFRYPLAPSVDYIKRVVGVPGDEIGWLNQRLFVNGQLAPVQPKEDYYDEESRRYAPQFSETLGSRPHDMLVDPRRTPFVRPMDEFTAFREQCRYSPEGVVCKVPAGHYFMMGDNRDNSQDSRFWGFVPDENIVGKAFVVWMNFGNFSRIGSFH
jgi:signal peptidase I